MTLQEVMDCCPNWEKFCELKGVSEWAVNEGYGHSEIELNLAEAHDLGILQVSEWKIDRYREQLKI